MTVVITWELLTLKMPRPFWGHSVLPQNWATSRKWLIIKQNGRKIVPRDVCGKNYNGFLWPRTRQGHFWVMRGTFLKIRL